MEFSRGPLHLAGAHDITAAPRYC